MTGRAQDEVQLLLSGPVGTSVELTFKPGPSKVIDKAPSSSSPRSVILLRRPQPGISLVEDLMNGAQYEGTLPRSTSPLSLCSCSGQYLCFWMDFVS